MGKADPRVLLCQYKTIDIYFKKKPLGFQLDCILKKITIVKLTSLSAENVEILTQKKQTPIPFIYAFCEV